MTLPLAALVIGTSESAVGIVNSLQDAGVRVHVAGNRKSDPMVRLVGETRWCDTDYSKDRATLRSYVIENNVATIIPSGNDAAYRACLDLNHHLDFRGFDTRDISAAITYKDLWAKLCLKHHFPAPRTMLGNSLSLLGELEELPNDCCWIKKPRGNNSGLGIEIFESKSELRSALYNSRTEKQTYVVQELIKGEHFSISAFIFQQTCRFFFTATEVMDHSSGGIWVKESVAPARIPAETIEQCIEKINALSVGAGFVDGLFHAQYILPEGSREALCIEAMRRLPGDFFGYHFQDGKRYHDLYCSAYFGDRSLFSIDNLTQSDLTGPITSRSVIVDRDIMRSCLEDRNSAASKRLIFSYEDIDGNGIGFNKKFGVLISSQPDAPT